MNQPNQPQMSGEQRPREFWIDDILNVDRPSEKTAYVHEQDTEKCHRAIHVIEFEAYMKAVEALKVAQKEIQRLNMNAPLELTMTTGRINLELIDTLRELGVEL